MKDFFRFPQTPHLIWFGETEPRDDKVLTAEQSRILLNNEIVVEEKIDGANLGFSIDSDCHLFIQNRGQYLQSPFTGQFARLSDWLDQHAENVQYTLAAHADNDLILFGEWCAARHSLDYDHLPDWFLMFDVYECGTKRFWSTERRDLLAKEIGLATVPRIFQGRLDFQELSEILEGTPSRFRAGPLEGLIIRNDVDNWCKQRAKIVRADFTQSIEDHWSRRRLEWNRVQW